MEPLRGRRRRNGRAAATRERSPLWLRAGVLWRSRPRCQLLFPGWDHCSLSSVCGVTSRLRACMEMGKSSAYSGGKKTSAWRLVNGVRPAIGEGDTCSLRGESTADHRPCRFLSAGSGTWLRAQLDDVELGVNLAVDNGLLGEADELRRLGVARVLREKIRSGCHSFAGKGIAPLYAMHEFATLDFQALHPMQMRRFRRERYLEGPERGGMPLERLAALLLNRVELHVALDERGPLRSGKRERSCRQWNRRARWKKNGEAAHSTQQK